MKTLSDEFIKELDIIKFRITGNGIPQESLLALSALKALPTPCCALALFFSSLPLW